MTTNKTNVDPNDVPEWLCNIINQLANRENITLEQATRMCIVQGALYYEKSWTCECQG